MLYLNVGNFEAQTLFMLGLQVKIVIGSTETEMIGNPILLLILLR